ncbi:ABC transporter substrate-binding protein [Flavobacterium sp.]|jgi:iron complex transport system substrate-binding protein|uniref:ABC transporter substrate-binding protein n=1 Tax=Flavobacterium sp. TaxID=239 RepID=UPI0022C2938E|nr:ABC transporter substrate-binding protein [Flavobacterium sp.]MCZ8145312.1 ABC transporter substrate-binding protein [Flavobacterium sp.]MCZ8368162.1 ABC transporter substrate-binding protein [Flavobacterium sp.]
MKSCIRLLGLLVLIVGFGCQSDRSRSERPQGQNTVRYATGFTLQNYQDVTVITVKNPWPEARQTYRYVLYKKGARIPDSLQQLPAIRIPIQKIVVTSTTHIPSLEMLKKVPSLVGFPQLHYISSTQVQARIAKGKIAELGKNQTLNIERLITLQPDVVIGYGIDNHNPTLDNLQSSGIKVLLNGDWNEQNPLGRAEWIKFFGALYDEQAKAAQVFTKIEKDYLNTKRIATRARYKPTVMAGDVFEGQWYLPKGDSWGSLLLKEAQGQYLWGATKGTGSLALSFETVFEKAQNADLWITSGQFQTLRDMAAQNPHYRQFKAFQNQKVYSFHRKKGKNSGSLYYELAPNRPDLVLKDLVKILHPELLPSYQPYFFMPLQP